MQDWIDRRLPELVEEHGVVGAQLGVLVGGEIITASAGVRNNVTGEPVTDDSIFQIGSITKVWTATLVQELVNEGLLDLDRPVRDVLPEFRLADEEAARVITPRQLLCHTAGFDGDQFADTGSDDEAVAKYVAILADATQVSSPGELYTYCNAGFVVLGRIVEVLRGRPYRQVLRDRLVDPLGLPHVATHRAEYAGHEVAEGHLPVDGVLTPVAEPLTESDAPAGSVLAMNVRDVLWFARMHLDTKAFDAMREHQVTPPDFGLGGRWGLGWGLHDYDNGTVGMGHTGMTKGYQAFLRVLPEAGVAVALLTNGGEPVPVVRALYEHLLSELAGVRIPALPTPPDVPQPMDVEKVVGVYRSSGLDVHVTASDDRLRVRFEPRNAVFEALMTKPATEYTGLRDDALIAVEPEDGYHPVLVLCGRDEQDRVKWVHYGRAAVRL